MIINQLMALLLPGIVTLKMYEKLEGEEKRVQKIVKKYLKAILIINVLVYLIVIYNQNSRIYIYKSVYSEIYIYGYNNFNIISFSGKIIKIKYRI